MKPNFETELKKEKNQRILSYLHKIKGLNHQEIEQLKLIVLWESIESFNPDKGCLFSTHLYNQCRFKFLKHINKRKSKNIDIDKFCLYYRECYAMIELPELYKAILHDRFITKLTIHQIKRKYSISKERTYELIETSKKELKKYLEK